MPQDDQKHFVHVPEEKTHWRRIAIRDSRRGYGVSQQTEWDRYEEYPSSWQRLVCRLILRTASLKTNERTTNVYWVGRSDNTVWCHQ